MFIRNFSNIPNKFSQVRKFSSNYESHMFNPFMASMFWGCLFTGITLNRIHSNGTKLMTKMYELEKEIKSLKK